MEELKTSYLTLISENMSVVWTLVRVIDKIEIIIFITLLWHTVITLLSNFWSRTSGLRGGWAPGKIILFQSNIFWRKKTKKQYEGNSHPAQYSNNQESHHKLSSAIVRASDSGYKNSWCFGLHHWLRKIMYSKDLEHKILRNCVIVNNKPQV